MYNRVTFNYDGIVAKGILLAEFDLVEPFTDYIDKKYLFFTFRKKIETTRNFKWYAVFVPWKHAMKDIIFITKKMIISIDYCSDEKWVEIKKFNSAFVKEHPYYCEYVVENFNGYEFIVKDNEFIANIRNGLSEYSLQTLYENLPSILKEEFDEDKAIRNYPVFITSKEREGTGTGYIELQYCKENITRIVALKKLKHFDKESLYIGVESFSIFEDQYLDIFISVNKNLSDIFEMEFFTLEQVKKIKALILQRKPIDYKIIIDWLDVCIKSGYSLYFLGV